MAETLTLFTSIGLSESKAKETQKNETLSALLKEAVIQVMAAVSQGNFNFSGAQL